jgi:LmbE family N-acetylglucosaminyl deacetylase
MLGLLPRRDVSRPLEVLCIGAHCDDIEIGCGGTLIELLRGGGPATVCWAVLSGTAERRAETEQAMAMLVPNGSRGELTFGDLADGLFPACYGEAKAFVERLKRLRKFDLVLCHERDDRHQDHRIVNEMVWNTFRDHLVLEYEVPKWDGGLGTPNVYTPLASGTAERKVAVLMDAYASQSRRDWFTPDTFLALMRLRGLECRSPSGYAEAFHGRKLRFDTERQ